MNYSIFPIFLGKYPQKQHLRGHYETIQQYLKYCCPILGAKSAEKQEIEAKVT